jgi:hypothetical protein
MDQQDLLGASTPADDAEVSAELPSDTPIELSQPRRRRERKKHGNLRPDGRRALTNTERSRRNRAKKKLEKLELEAEEAAKQRALLAKQVREKRALTTTSGIYEYDYPTAITEDDAKEELYQRGIHDANSISQIVAEIPSTCLDLGIVANGYVYRNGIQQALNALKQKVNLAPTEVTDEPGGLSEVLPKYTLFRLFDSICTGRTILGQSLTFDEWLVDIRDRFRKDLYWGAHDLLRVPLDEKVHRPVTDGFYPKLNFDGLYPPDYTLDDAHQAIAKAVGDVRWHHLEDPRGYIKSGLFIVFVLQFLANVPDGRVFIVSGTDTLAEGFLRILKGYLGRVENSVPENFLLAFPEYALRGVDSTSEEPLLLPCRRWKQRDWSVWTAGWKSAASGGHVDLFGIDDPVQEEGSEITRLTLQNKVDNLLLNIPDSHAPIICLGTRYHPQDYYASLIQMYEDDPSAMKLITRSAWKWFPGFENTDFADAEIGENANGELLWPTKVGTPEKTLADLKRRYKKNKNDFMHQMMNSPVVPSEGDRLPVFTEDMLRKCMKPASEFPPGEIISCCDFASSEAKYADYTAIVTFRCVENEAGLKTIYILHITAGHWKQSDVAKELAKSAQRWNPKYMIGEKCQGWELLHAQAKLEAGKLGISFPSFYWIEISLNKAAKTRRVKNLEMLFANQRLWLPTVGGEVELAMMQFVRFDGKRSGGLKHDDIPDCIALAAEHCGLSDNPKVKDDAEMQKAKEEAEQEYLKKLHYNAIFNPATRTPPPMEEDPAPSGTYSRFGIRVPGLR